VSVGGINDRVPLSQSALSQHLSVLRDARLVITTRQSQTIYYALASGPALQIMEVLYAAFCAPAGSATRARKDRCQPTKRAGKH
jgi:DNA-binding transcriptional ArsR family regulator